MLNKFLDADVVIGDVVVYIRADFIGVPTSWKATAGRAEAA